MWGGAFETSQLRKPCRPAETGATARTNCGTQKDRGSEDGGAAAIELDSNRGKNRIAVIEITTSSARLTALSNAVNALRVTVTQGRQSDMLSFSESIETEIDIWL